MILTRKDIDDIEDIERVLHRRKGKRARKTGNGQKVPFRRKYDENAVSAVRRVLQEAREQPSIPQLQATLAKEGKHFHLHERHPDRPTREENPRGFNDQFREIPPGFPYEVTLHREAHWAHSGRHDGVLVAARIAPEDVETRRADRLRVALNGKCPKLQLCKDEGARTVLVLEDGDIALTNYVLVGEVLAELLGEYADPPDEIYLVETAVDEWGVRLMKNDEGLTLEGEWTVFHLNNLIDLTANVEARTT